MFEIIVHISSHIHYITYYHDISTALYLQKPGSQKDPSFVSLKSILICQKKWAHISVRPPNYWIRSIHESDPIC